MSKIDKARKYIKDESWIKEALIELEEEFKKIDLEYIDCLNEDSIDHLSILANMKIDLGLMEKPFKLNYKLFNEVEKILKFLNKLKQLKDKK